MNNKIQLLSVRAVEVEPNIDAENAVIGAVMISKDAMPVVVDFILNPDYFLDINNRSIYTACLNLYARGLPIDFISVRTELVRIDSDNAPMLTIHMVQVSSNVVSDANLDYHCRLVVEVYLRVRIIQIGIFCLEKAKDKSMDVFNTLDNIEKLHLKLTQQNIRKTFTSMDMELMEYTKRLDLSIKNKGIMSGIPTGWIELDELTSGLKKAELTIIAGRPSMGKTAIACNLTVFLSKVAKKNVGFFSIEQPSGQIVDRMVSAECSISSSKIALGNLSTYELAQISEARTRLSGIGLAFDDTPDLNLQNLRSKARKLYQEGLLDVLVVDYLQKVKPNYTSRGSNRNNEVGEISNGLKELARELDIPVIALAQIGRSAEQNPGKKPQMKDLRESGNIEADADQVWLLYRPDYYNITTDEAGDSVEGMGIVIVAKNRNGSVGEAKLHYVKECMRFDNIGNRNILQILKPSDIFSVKTDESAPF
jgi:replicative DNA helicase